MMDNRNRDRGTIKWTSLMLPEHVEMVKKLWKEDQRVEKGIMDEQKAVEIDFLLQRALTDNLTVQVRVHNGFEYEDIRMKVTHVNRSNHTVAGVDGQTKEKVRIPLDDIADLAIL
ncbi:YolD-like family protein [Halobacillus sp. HZG1]|uniref:YolD-like family protein n=1 Tax=Halobacillus sp. HZG1 TaxID=3111769 RepID=UPI002DBCBFF5|nr:YolD-like family protein [Halobacillus sp. HZG1]MEC3885002.1 YolD-like family protein [Halobacillus sp. HZG1]